MLYLYRRRLSMTPEERDALPWWLRRAYDEGLAEEFRDPESDAPSTFVEGTSDNLASLGVSVDKPEVA